MATRHAAFDSLEAEVTGFDSRGEMDDNHLLGEDRLGGVVCGGRMHTTLAEVIGCDRVLFVLMYDALSLFLCISLSLSPHLRITLQETGCGDSRRIFEKRRLFMK